MIDTVVLAGGIEKGEIFAETGVAHRALLEVGGMSILQRIVAALRGASSVGRVALVAPEAVQAAVGDDAIDFRAPSGNDFVENICRGVEATAPGSERVLVLTGDLPLITPAALEDFLRQSLAAKADVTYPIIPKASCERAFPGGRRTYVRLREGTFTGGNGVVLTRPFLERSRDLINRLFASRKSPVKLAALLGIRVLLGLATGRLQLPQLEARASSIIGGRVSAIISAYPELGFDVDKMEDLRLCQRIVASSM